MWYNSARPSERDVKPDNRQHKLGGYILWHEEALVPLLSEQAKEIYEKLRDCRAELQDLEECEAFCTGFRLGARIAYETMEGMDVPSIDD